MWLKKEETCSILKQEKHEKIVPYVGEKEGAS
jgi:hypothetical protein